MENNVTTVVVVVASYFSDAFYDCDNKKRVYKCVVVVTGIGSSCVRIDMAINGPMNPSRDQRDTSQSPFFCCCC